MSADRTDSPVLNYWPPPPTTPLFERRGETWIYVGSANGHLPATEVKIARAAGNPPSGLIEAARARGAPMALRELVRHAVNGETIRAQVQKVEAAAGEGEGALTWPKGTRLAMVKRGVYLDLAACEEARRRLKNPSLGRSPQLRAFWRLEKGEGGDPEFERFAPFANGGFPLLLGVWHEAGDLADVDPDEFRVAWYAPAERWFRPVRARGDQIARAPLWRKLHVVASSPSDIDLCAAAIEAQARDIRAAVITALPSPGNVFEGGRWRYGYSCGDTRRADSRDPDRRLVAELGEDGAVRVGNAASEERREVSPIPLDRLELLGDYMEERDAGGKALATLCFGARSICADIAPVHVTLILAGATSSGKTTMARLVARCVSPMGWPEFRLAGGGGTTNSIDGLFAGNRACLALFDDKADEDPETARTLVRVVSVVHEGGQSRRRLNRDSSAREGAYVEVGVAITAENLIGLRKSRQNRCAILHYPEEALDVPRRLHDLAEEMAGKPIDPEDFETVNEAAVAPGSEAMRGVLRYIMRRLGTLFGSALAEGMDPEAAAKKAIGAFAAQIEVARRRIIGRIMRHLRRERPRGEAIKRAAEAFSEIWLGAVLLDRSAGFHGGIDVDTLPDQLGPITGRLRRHLVALACRSIDIIGGRVPIEQDPVAERFPGHLRRVLASRKWCLAGQDGNRPSAPGIPADALGWEHDSEKSLWRAAPKKLGAFTEHEIWLEPSLFSAALSEVRDPEIDYDNRPDIIARLARAGIAMRGDGRHLTPKRGGDRRIVLRTERIFTPAEAIVDDGCGREPGEDDDDGDPGGGPGGAPMTDIPLPGEDVSLPVAAAATTPSALLDAQLAMKATAADDPPARTSLRGGSGAAPVAAPSNRGRLVMLDAVELVTLDGDNRITRRPLDDLSRPGGGGIARCFDLAERENAEGVWLAKSWGVKSGLPDIQLHPRSSAVHPWAEMVDHPVWRISTPGDLRPWIWGTHKPTGGTAAIVLTWTDRRWPWAVAESAYELALAIAAFRAVTASAKRRGFTPRNGPGAMGVGMLRAFNRGGAGDLSRAIAPNDYPTPTLEGYTGGVGEWTRPPFASETETRRLVMLDVNGMYLGGSSSVAAGFGDPSHFGERAFDPRAHGYWYASVDRSSIPPGLPDPFGNGWLSTEALVYATDLKARFVIREAWLWTEAHRVCEPFYRRMKAAREKIIGRIAEASSAPEKKAAEIAFAALKRVYCQTYGWLGCTWADEEPLYYYRPDARHALIARAGCNMNRGLHTAGVRAGFWPVATTADAALYLTDLGGSDLLARLGLKAGTGLGGWKIAHDVPAPGLARRLVKAKDDREAWTMIRDAIRSPMPESEFPERGEDEDEAIKDLPAQSAEED